MGLRIKNFNNMGFAKNQYREGNCRKRWFGQFADLRGLAKETVMVFLRRGVGDNPMNTIFQQLNGIS